MAGPTNTTPLEYLDLFANTLGRCGKWRQALAYARVLVDQHPDSFRLCHTLAPLLAAVNDLKGYQETCRNITARFSTAKNTEVADPMAKDCLILPNSVADLKPVAAMAETAVRQGLFVKRVQVLCPDGAVAATASSVADLPSRVRCWEDYDGDLVPIELETSGLHKLEVYAVPTEKLA